MKRHVIALVLAGMLALPAAALAQGHAEHHPQGQPQEPSGQGMMGQAQGMMGMMGGMGMMGPSPQWILRQKDALNLSESQVERLEALAKQAADAREAHMREAMPIHQQAMKALEAEKPDLAAYESALKKLAEGHVKMHVEMARLGQQALDVLTPEQRSNVRYGMRLMRDMMGGMMQGGMMQGGGMMGGMGMMQGMMRGMDCPMMGGMGRQEK